MLYIKRHLRNNLLQEWFIRQNVSFNFIYIKSYDLRFQKSQSINFSLNIRIKNKDIQLFLSNTEYIIKLYFSWECKP